MNRIKRFLLIVLVILLWIIVLLAYAAKVQAQEKEKYVPQGKTVTHIGCKMTEVGGGIISHRWNVDVNLTFSDNTTFEKLYATVLIEGNSDKDKDRAETKAYKYCVEFKRKVRKEIKEAKK